MRIGYSCLSALLPSRAFPALAVLALLLASLLSLGAAPRSGLRAQGSLPKGEFSAELSAAMQYLLEGKRSRALAAAEELEFIVEEEAEEDWPSKAERAEVFEIQARVALDRGQYDKVARLIASAKKLSPHPDQEMLLARSLARTGKYDPAIALLSGLIASQPKDSELALEARVRAADLHELRGRDKQRDELLVDVIQIGKTNVLRSPWQKIWYGEALARFGPMRLPEASQIFLECSKEEPRLARAYIALGDLYFRVYREAAGRPSGESEYKRALERCGEQEDALIGLFLSRETNYLLDSSKTESYLERALALNPRSVPALRARASRAINNRAFEQARAMLDEALAVDPNDPETLAQAISVAHLTYRKSEEAKLRKRLEDVRPGDARVDLVLGQHLGALYRFADSLPYLLRARQNYPNDVDTLVTLGRALIYSGRGDEAYKHFKRSREIERGFVRPWRDNQMALQERLDSSYQRYERGNFIFVLHPDEVPVMLPYLSDTYERAWRVLGSKYGTYPGCKVRVEKFHRFGDFSVRTVGFKGFGALGACFGCFITSVSPQAPEIRQQFSWKVTAWHEFSHVLHLELSKARVPRWLTEGMAVFEEMGLDASFDRRMERELKTALVNDSIFGLTELNNAFRGPKILFGYYQGGLIAKYLAREYGFAKLVELVKAYGEDKNTPQIFREVLGLSPQQFDAAFKQYVNELVGPYEIEPRIEDATMQKLLVRVARNPGDIEGRIRLAQGFRQRGNVIDCGTQLAALRKIDPDNGEAYLVRAKLALDRKDVQEARKLLQLAFENGADDFDARMAYGDILMRAGRKTDALEQFDRAIECWPTCSERGAPRRSRSSSRS
jgi:tetratricopeptide (TPR) repeat protein